MVGKTKWNIKYFPQDFIFLFKLLNLIVWLGIQYTSSLWMESRNALDWGALNIILPTGILKYGRKDQIDFAWLSFFYS